MLDLWVSKALMSVALLTTNFIIGSIVIFVMGQQNVGSKWTEFSNSLTCGLFIGIVFLLLSPEVPIEEDLVRKTHSIELHLPIGQIFIAVGFLIMLFIQHLAKILSAKYGTQGHGHGGNHGQPPNPEQPAENAEEQQALERHSEEGKAEEEGPKNSPRAAVTLHGYIAFNLLMSLHSLTEGIPLGLKTTTSGAIAFFVPLILHKILEAACVGAAGSHEKKLYAVIGSLIHAAMSPVGVLIGALMVSTNEGVLMGLTVLGLKGLSAGSLIFVTFVELLPQELDDSHEINPFIRFIIVCFGFATTLGITVGITYVETLI